MSGNREVTLYYWPQSRAAATLELLEELGAPYRLEVIDITRGEQNAPAFLAVNPMGKVPAAVMDGVVVTEQIAIFTWLSDLFPEAGLTPAAADPLRGPWLRWLAFYAGCFEPAMMDRALKHPPPPRVMSPYGGYDLVVETLRGQLAKGPFILGARFTTADVLWSTALTFMTAFGLLEKTGDIAAYLARTDGRPARQRASAINARIMAERA